MIKMNLSRFVLFSLFAVNATFAGTIPKNATPKDTGAPLQTDPAVPKDAQQAKDFKEIDGLWDQITAAYRMRDPLAAMDGMIKSDDFVEFDVVMPFSDPGYNRNLEKTKAWMNQSKGPTDVIYFDRKVVMLSADSAYGTAFIHFVGTTLAGDKIDVTARHTRVIRKIGGRWLCVLEHTSRPEGWSVQL